MYCLLFVFVSSVIYRFSVNGHINVTHHAMTGQSMHADSKKYKTRLPFGLIFVFAEYKLMQAALFPRKVVQQHILIGPINNDTESAFIGTIFFSYSIADNNNIE